MKIRKSPSRKLAPMPRQLRQVIECLENGPEEEIPIVAEKIKDWTFPRGDVFRWVAALNRFDSILQRVCDEYHLETIQTQEFESGTKNIILAIVNISRILFENCTNRNIYNSFEYMNLLLNTIDIDVLLATLRFMIRPAQRVNHLRSIRSTFVVPHEKITELARGWALDSDLVELCSDTFTPTEDMTLVKLQFYRTQENTNEPEKSNPANDTMSSEPSEGINVVTTPMGQYVDKSDAQTFQDLVKQHNIPADYQFQLNNRIRIAKHIGDPIVRKKLLNIRILAIGIMAYTVSETTAQNRVFVYEPHLVANLVDLLRPEKAMSYDTQSFTLSALDGIARHRGKLTEVLTALNASANHGVILQILRRINQEQSNVFPRDFLDALFLLLTCLLQNQPGGQMLMSAGIITTLVNVLGNQNCIPTKYVSKVVSLLDTIVISYTTSFSAFCNAGGLDTLLSRIKTEVEQCLQVATDNMEGIELASASDPKADDDGAQYGPLAPHDKVSAIKAMLRFLLRMMEASGTADGLRNLIDSTIPASLREIITHPKVFGHNILTLAINVMTTFIHSEPTSLPILQEAKLPQLFLETLNSYDNPNSEVLMAAVNAFGAICLNGPGLAMFNDAKPLPHFFELMTRSEFLRNPTEVESATALGSTMDELTRHHPSVKSAVFECVTNMIKKVITIGNDPAGKPNDDSHQLQVIKHDSAVEDKVTATGSKTEKSSSASTEDEKKDDKSECLLVSYIDLISRFLEGLFQNQSNIREFIKEGCPEILLEYYTLPLLPADFSVTIASDSLAYIFKMISEVSALPTVMAIAEKVKQSMKFIIEDTSPRSESMLHDLIDIKDNETEKIERGNKLFRQLIIMHGYLGLLSNICCATVLSPGKNGLSFVTEFISDSGDGNIIAMLGQVHRVAIWENYLLKESIPSSWYSFKSTKKGSSTGTGAEHHLGIFGVDVPQSQPSPGSQEESSRPATSSAGQDTDKPEEPKVPNADDPRMLNIKHFKLLLGDIPQFLMPIFHGMLKVVTRPVRDSTLRVHTFKLSSCITEVLKENLVWPCIESKGYAACKYEYLTAMYSMISLLLKDDRTQASLNTPLALTFDRQKGTELLLEKFDELWKDATQLHSAKEDEEKDRDGLLLKVYNAIEMLLTVLTTLASSKLLHSSPYTTPIVVKERKSPDFFDPTEWSVSMQLKLMPMRNYLESSDLSQFSKMVIHDLLELILELLKGETETPARSEPPLSFFAAPLSSSPFTVIRTPTVADARGVQRLVDMGFDRSAAENAMIRCNNQITRAVDYLFSHPAQLPLSTGPSGSNPAQTNNESNNEASESSQAQDGEDSESEFALLNEAGSSMQNQDHEDEDDNDLDNDEEDIHDGFAVEFGLNRMDSDTQPDSSADGAASERSGDKGKQRAETSSLAKELQAIRASMKHDIPPLVLNLVDKREDVIFDIRDLLIALCKNDTEDETAKYILSLLIQRIDSARQDVKEAQPETTSILSVRLRLLALLFRAQCVQNTIPTVVAELSFLFDMVATAASLPVETPLPTWLTAVFLVLEAFIAQSDEPRKVALMQRNKEGSSSGSDDMSGVEGAFPEARDDNNEAMDEGVAASTVTAEQRSQLLHNCVTFLKKSHIARDDIYAILRILVRLTKYHSAAVEFVECGGLSLLFSKPRSSLEGLQGQQAFIILILRHIIEDKAVLKSSMEDMVTTWFTIPRPRNMDIVSFIRNNSQVALRDPSMFLEVSEKLCRLVQYNEHEISHQIKLASNETATSSDAPNTTATTTEGNGDSGERNADAAQPQFSPDEQPSTNYSSAVINHLLQELLSARNDDTGDKAEMEQGTDEAGSAKNRENVRYAYTGFVLQCLVELVSSYRSCKYDVYAFSRRRNSKDGSGQRQRHSVIHTLINDLLPYNAINPTAEESRKQHGLSIWTASVLVAMCYDSGPESDSDNVSKNDLAHVRRYVSDGIIRSLKDTIASQNSLATKYGKFLALSDLCHRILNARPNSGIPAQRIKEDVIMEIAKIMLEKNFVGVLTSAISDVDINHPQAKTVLNAMLRPLEQLTKIAIKVSDETKEDDKKREELESFVTTDSDAETEEEAPDLYRNSALGMFDGSVMEEDEMDEFGSEEDVEESFDEEEFDEETGSDLSDMSEDEDGDENVDEEMDVMMHHHHHYGSEMDEDEEGTEDEDDASEGDSNTGSDLDAESDEDDIDDEDGREMTWRLEDIEDDPVIRIHSADVDDSEEEDRHDHGHRPTSFDEGHDDELDTLDQSEFDEDEESENIDGEAEVELNDGLLVGEDDLDNPFLAQDFPPGSLILGEEGRQRSLGSFGYRRLQRSPNRSRLVVDPVPRPFRNPVGVNGAGGNAQDDIITHPLLSENQSETRNESQPRRFLADLASQPRSRSAGFSSWQAFEDMIGGSAVRLLENFLSHAPASTQGALRVDVQGRSGGMMRTFEFDRFPFGGAQSSRFPADTQNTDPNRELMAVLHDFQPMTTVDRWNQEARMMYGNSQADKAQNLTNTLLNAIIPIAIEDEKKRREEEERNRQEQRRIAENERKKAEEERWKREEEERKRKEEEERASQENRDLTQAGEAESSAAAVEQAGEQAASTPAAEEGNARTTITIHGESIDISGMGIDIEFLEALPDDLREEVINQHIRERRETVQPAETDSISPEFLDALPPDIREEVIRQEAIERERRDRQRQGGQGAQSGQGSGLVSHGTNEESALHSFLSSRADRRSELAGETSGGSSQRKSGVHRSMMQLVDRSQLATLARLLFVPQSISKSLLNKLLLNLCENNKTRSDLLSFLVCILHDGSGDLSAVDRSFAQLSLQSKGPQKPVAKNKPAVPAVDEAVPNLITQRCLEFLMHVVSTNDQSLTYFLTENDCLIGLKRSNSRKGKTKEKVVPSSKYPLLVLVNLLDRPVFIENPSLMEELMRLITTICRPFPVIVKKYVEKQEKQEKQDREEKATEGGEAKAESGKPSAESSSNKERPMAKPPTIPDHYLKLVVHVLTSGDCSSKTFQYTLSALSYLSALDGAQQAIINELVANAKQSGAQILQDLGELLDVLENTMPGTEIQGSTLSHFSAASSDQAKLLRVLKTIDYLYSRKANTAENGGKESTEETEKKEQQVLAIYEELGFLPLWKKLGACLSVIHEKEDLINVATVLLPLIESFMVVSKYATEKNRTTTRGSAPSPTQSTDSETPDEFFFKFTEEHRKILNIMVRNNPSLMSGSFSLLVRNPKMLEFDNKRNYFVQQLHKRTGPREHYPQLQLNVRRQNVFEDSYHQLLGRTGDEIKYGKLNVRFYDEEGVDAGGVTREWFSVLARQMFNPNYALFITSAADKLTYQPNRASSVNPEHLSYLKFIGRVIGKAIYDGRLLDAYFTRSFYKHILARTVDYRDVEAVDPEYYKSLVWMLENDITDVMDLTFSTETDDFDNTVIIDLKPNGREIPVTEENKHEYVALITEQKLTLAIKDQIQEFLKGFHDIIPPQLIQIFNEQELELLISGLPDIDIDDWKNNTEYQGYTASSPQIQWFWRAVRSFDQEERAKLLQFSTGTSKVPLEGFSHLQGSGGVQRFQIHKDFGGTNRLPSAHTCFNQIDLPEYESYESLRSALYKAISECSTGFGFV